MNLPQVFNYDNRDIRVVMENGEPWWVAKDVCEILEISNSRDAVSRLDEDERGVVLTDTPGGPQEMIAVNEPGLYTLILGSRKPEAKAFKRWITHEVIPTIRRTGTYALVPKTLPEALRAYADEVERRQLAEAQIALMAPKAEFFDAVTDSKDAIAIGEAAKVLNMGIGRNKLFQILRGKKILMRNNVPYQEFIDRGYFRVVEQKWTTTEGETRISIKTLVYQKGLDFIRRQLESTRAV